MSFRAESPLLFNVIYCYSAQLKFNLCQIKVPTQFVVKIVQIQRSAKIAAMGHTKRISHCGYFLLAEVVVLFSQQIKTKNLPKSLSDVIPS